MKKTQIHELKHVFLLNLSLCNPTNTWDSLPFSLAQENGAQKATQSTDLNFKKTEAVSERE